MKIISVAPLGGKQTYNVSMKSEQHNYILRPSSKIVHRNSHAVAYSIITYRCLYLKSHYPAEWWAAVMTECHPKKLDTYMSAARLEDVQFGMMDIDALSKEYSVMDGKVVPGLVAIKGVGEKACNQFTEAKGPYKDIDDVVTKCGKSKTVMERLIKLGVLDRLHPNRQGLWAYYKYKYCSGTDVTALKKIINAKFQPTQEELEVKRQQKIADYKKLYPKKKKMPNQIINFTWKVVPTRDQIIDLFEDYSSGERLIIEKQFLGYYWSDPLEMYLHEGDHTIEDAKANGVLEAVVESVTEKHGKSGLRFYVLRVTDGIQSADVTIWQDIYHATDLRVFEQGRGVKIQVDYSPERKNFKISTNTHVIPLIPKDSTQAVQFTEMGDDKEVLW